MDVLSLNARQRIRTVADAFGSIPKDSPNQVMVYNSGEEFIERIKMVKQGDGLYGDKFRSAYRRLHWNKPSPTAKENHGAMFIHPSEHRMINVREFASLQSFPHDYEFIGIPKNVIKIIGNAIPCLTAEVLGKMFKDAIEENSKRESKIDEK